VVNQSFSRFNYQFKRLGIWKKEDSNGLGNSRATQRSPLKGTEKKSINVYKNACATLSNTFVSVGQVDQFQLLLNQPVVLLVQLNVREYGRR
jgi:hypothetical protein